MQNRQTGVFRGRRWPTVLMTLGLLGALGIATIHIIWRVRCGDHWRFAVGFLLREHGHETLARVDPCGEIALVLVLFALLYVVWRGPQTVRREWKTVLGRIILMSVSIAFTLLAAEITLRSVMATRSRANDINALRKKQTGKRVRVQGTHPLIHIIRASANTNLIYDLQPGLDIDFGHRRLRTNADGMRQDRTFPTDKPEHTVRIVGIGDSGMFGWDLQQGQCYMDVLASNCEVAPQGPPVQVLNLACPGYNTAQEVESLAYTGLKYEPDIVVVGWCDNDFDIPFCVPQPANFSRKDKLFLHYLLFDRDELKRLCFSRVSDRREAETERVPTDVLSLSGPKGVRRSLERLRALAEAHDFRVLVFGPMGDDIVRLCGDLGLSTYNTRKEIAADQYPEEFAIHFMHPKAAGHAALAKHLEQTLRTRGWLSVVPQ